MGILKNGRYSVTFPSNIKYLSKVEELTSQITRELNFDNEARDDLLIAITELFNNALHHGNQGDEEKKITVTYRVLKSGLQISVRDEGVGFNPQKIRNPLADENLLRTSGRGLFLVEQLVDDLRFNITPEGSEIIILKKIKH